MAPAIVGSPIVDKPALQTGHEEVGVWPEHHFHTIDSSGPLVPRPLALGLVSPRRTVGWAAVAGATQRNDLADVTPRSTRSGRAADALELLAFRPRIRRPQVHSAHRFSHSCSSVPELHLAVRSRDLFSGCVSAPFATRLLPCQRY